MVNGAIPVIQILLMLATLVVVGLIAPLVKRIDAARTDQIGEIHACLDRIETKLDRHLEWHLGKEKG